MNCLENPTSEIKYFLFISNVNKNVLYFRKIEISHTDEDDPNKLRSRSSKTVTSKIYKHNFYLNKLTIFEILVTSSNPTLLSSSKVDDKLKLEEDDVYDEDGKII